MSILLLLDLPSLFFLFLLFNLLLEDDEGIWHRVAAGIKIQLQDTYAF